MTPILTDDQILACLSQTGDRQAMLQAAARMGMMRAAEIAFIRAVTASAESQIQYATYGCNLRYQHLRYSAIAFQEIGDAIRAAAEANPPPREPSPKS